MSTQLQWYSDSEKFDVINLHTLNIHMPERAKIWKTGNEPNRLGVSANVPDANWGLV